MLKHVVNIVEAAAVLLVAVAIVMLFTNDPTAPPAAAAGIDVPAEIDAAAVFGASCASCHGGDGSGGIGPPLKTARIVSRFPAAADQVAVVTDGRGGMPSFGSRLSVAQIGAVVEYTRTSLL